MNPARILAALMLVTFLAGTHWKAYKAGGNVVQAEWTAERLQASQDALKAFEQVRAKEADLQTKVRKVTNDYAAEKTRHARTAADLDVSLRQLQATLGDAPPTDPAALIGADDAARARFVVGECAAALSKVAQAADASDARLSALQDYVRAVGLSEEAQK